MNNNMNNDNNTLQQSDDSNMNPVDEKLEATKTLFRSTKTTGEIPDQIASVPSWEKVEEGGTEPQDEDHSLTNFSFGSGISCSRSQNNNSHRHHRRNVSFDQEAKHATELVRQRLLQNAGGSQRKLGLDDLLQDSRYEHEATTNILKTLDEKLKPNSAAFDSSSVLPGLSDQASRNLVDEDSSSQQHTDGGSSTSPGHATASRRRNSGSNHPDGTMEHRPLLKKSTHRRELSVEDQLVGLTSAMMNMTDHEDLFLGGGGKDMRTNTGVDDFHRNAQRVVGGDDFGVTQSNRPRLFSGESAMLDPVPEAMDSTESKATSQDEDSGSDSNPSSGDNAGHKVPMEGDIESGMPSSRKEDTMKNENPNDKAFEKAFGGGNKSNGKRNSSKKEFVVSAADKLKDDLDAWNKFLRPRREHILRYTRTLFMYLLIPLMGVSALLFYVLDNPIAPQSGASYSWWLLYCARQLVTLSIAVGCQALVIDFLCVGTKFCQRFLGHVLTLIVVQSKGWPFVIFCWSLLDLGMLYGAGSFQNHWLYWQDYISIWNANNPSGNVMESDLNRTILLIGTTVPIAVALKRFGVGLFLGRQTFNHYGEQLAAVMKKMILITEVAQMAKQAEKVAEKERRYRRGDSLSATRFQKALQQARVPSMSRMLLEGQDSSLQETTSSNSGSNGAGGGGGNPYFQRSSSNISAAGRGGQGDNEDAIDFDNRNPITGSLQESERMKLMEHLDRWEEPERRNGGGKNGNASISSVLKFKNALTLIKNDYPFSYAFGLADTRKTCVDTSQELYHRLLRNFATQNGNGNNTNTVPQEGIEGEEQEAEELNFQVLALTALVGGGGGIDERKIKDLIKVFRPNRDGRLSVLDFVQSIDAVYKEFRLLQASIENSSQIDRAFENIFNVAFYTGVVVIIMSQLGFDPLSLFLSLSSIILAFAFMIGSASSKYFEGLLFILVRRPYGIGDLINVNGIDEMTGFMGSIGWIVQNVTLYETTFTWLPTMETASVANGALASSRIVNWARSPNARFVIFLYFPIETKYETLELFQGAVKEYMKVRPREWLALNAFRVLSIQTDKGYMQLELVVQHREAWQNPGAIYDSRGNLVSYCNEVQKLLGMQYRAPPLPIDLNANTFNNASIPLNNILAGANASNNNNSNGMGGMGAQPSMVIPSLDPTAMTSGMVNENTSQRGEPSSFHGNNGNFNNGNSGGDNNNNTNNQTNETGGTTTSPTTPSGIVLSDGTVRGITMEQFRKSAEGKHKMYY